MRLRADTRRTERPEAHTPTPRRSASVPVGNDPSSGIPSQLTADQRNETPAVSDAADAQDRWRVWSRLAERLFATAAESWRAANAMRRWWPIGRPLTAPMIGRRIAALSATTPPLAGVRPQCVTDRRSACQDVPRVVTVRWQGCGRRSNRSWRHHEGDAPGRGCAPASRLSDGHPAGSSVHCRRPEVTQCRITQRVASSSSGSAAPRLIRPTSRWDSLDVWDRRAEVFDLPEADQAGVSGEPRFAGTAQQSCRGRGRHSRSAQPEGRTALGAVDTSVGVAPIDRAVSMSERRHAQR